jgi:large subunit ribosomal protein L7A
MIQTIRDANQKVVGLKQTLRAIQQNKVKEVYFAADIEAHIFRKIADTCREKGINLIPAEVSQKELGRFCQIEVGAAVIGLIE